MTLAGTTAPREVRAAAQRPGGVRPLGPRERAALRRFTRITGPNWATGRHLIPALQRFSSPSGVVLDIGCGQSPFREFFPATLYAGFDLNRSGAADIIADIRAVPVRTGIADVVLMFHVLGDVDEPTHALRELRRILRPGGRALILESTCYPPHDLPYDFFRFMPNGLAALAAREGLRVTAVTPLGGLFTRIASLVNNYLLGRFVVIRGIGGIARVGVAMVNIVSALGDRIARAESLSESYLAELGHAS